MKMRRTVFRTNVVVLVGAGYVSLLFMFIGMVWWPGGMSAEAAYDVVQGPLMALIGGSLAISKDLIPLDEDESPVENNQNAEEDRHNPEQRNDNT